MKQKIWFAAAVTALAVVVSGSSMAATSKLTNVTISQLKAATANFGECTVRVNQDINNDGTSSLACGNSAVISLGCDGAFHTKSAAANMFTTAQMALALGSTVTIWVNDSKVYNSSVCTAESVIYNQQ